MKEAVRFVKAHLYSFKRFITLGIFYGNMSKIMYLIIFWCTKPLRIVCALVMVEVDRSLHPWILLHYILTEIRAPVSSG